MQSLPWINTTCLVEGIHYLEYSECTT